MAPLCAIVGPTVQLAKSQQWQTVDIRSLTFSKLIVIEFVRFYVMKAGSAYFPHTVMKNKYQ